ncbi:hypothetical protein [Flavobacterium johnsoniae]|uniref:Uncharacterized protein n=1 Tax=Flavobacterium johnsoniae TaxID=986 RepID=A0A1M5IY50_FLAJO|nr:hypothetical protein [Flavobacterium johnsoniae]SHG33191.1 hypothetical protein SAMN05444388_102300 [Flavobacterium johnsoniae]
MGVKQNTVRLHQDIKREFEKMSNIREFGVKKYSTEYVLKVVAKKYYRAVKTVENIVFNRVNYQNKSNSQAELFNS